MNQPIFLEPVFQERIWGGTALKDKFGYHIPSEKTGECWAISGHQNGKSVVKNGPFKGRTVDELWKKNRELFGNHPSPIFPILTKLLDVNSDLSVQVHPGNEYAAQYENGEIGKTECWYIIDCKENAELVLGHNAKSKEELVDYIENGDWDSLLRRIRVSKGDFFYVPSGTVHALCEGLLVLETQQSSDLTYRLYDYDRKDQNGNKRMLHLGQAIDVTTVPHMPYEIAPRIDQHGLNIFISLLHTEHFTVNKWEINESAEIVQHQLFQLVSIINGAGKIIVDGQSFKIVKGDHFILPADIKAFSIDGNFEAIVSYS